MADVAKPGIGGPEWGRLTVAERIQLCHEYAREALLLAHAATPEMRPKYKAIAAQWHTLAAEIEQAGGEALGGPLHKRSRPVTP